jgi:hypothetical protein
MATLDIVSIDEIAERLKITRHEAELVTASEDFPAPAASLGIGPVWSWTDIEADISSN